MLAGWKRGGARFPEISCCGGGESPRQHKHTFFGNVDKILFGKFLCIYKYAYKVLRNCDSTVEQYTYAPQEAK